MDMELSDLELHDARLLATHFDVVAQVADIRIAYYPSPTERNRMHGVLRFTGVRHFNQLADSTALAAHASFGNISHWVTGETPGMTYIYLARGLIVIEAAAVVLLADS